eukprot:6948160-Alexandrium_andersonii.AAC.1
MGSCTLFNTGVRIDDKAKKTYVGECEHARRSKHRLTLVRKRLVESNASERLSPTPGRAPAHGPGQ